jgi:hypothetical protein
VTFTELLPGEPLPGPSPYRVPTRAAGSSSTGACGARGGGPGGPDVDQQRPVGGDPGAEAGIERELKDVRS